VDLKDIAQLCEIRDVSGGIRRLDTHDARHFFADMMLNNGVPLEDVSKMLGHTSIRTTMRYCRVRKSRISENVAKVRKKLFSKSGELRSVAQKASVGTVPTLASVNFQPSNHQLLCV